MLGRQERIAELEDELSHAVPGSQDEFEIKKELDLLASEEGHFQRQLDLERDPLALRRELEALRGEFHESALGGGVDEATRVALGERIEQLEGLLMDRGTDPDMPVDW